MFTVQVLNVSFLPIHAVEEFVIICTEVALGVILGEVVSVHSFVLGSKISKFCVFSFNLFQSVRINIFWGKITIGIETTVFKT